MRYIYYFHTLFSHSLKQIRKKINWDLTTLYPNPTLTYLSFVCACKQKSSFSSANHQRPLCQINSNTAEQSASHSDPKKMDSIRVFQECKKNLVKHSKSCQDTQNNVRDPHDRFQLWYRVE